MSESPGDLPEDSHQTLVSDGVGQVREKEGNEDFEHPISGLVEGTAALQPTLASLLSTPASRPGQQTDRTKTIVPMLQVPHRRPHAVPGKVPLRDANPPSRINPPATHNEQHSDGHWTSNVPTHVRVASPGSITPGQRKPPRQRMLTLKEQISATAASYSSRPNSSAPAMSAEACPNCGNIYVADAIFCRRCGHRRVQASPDRGLHVPFDLLETLNATAKSDPGQVGIPLPKTPRQVPKPDGPPKPPSVEAITRMATPREPGASKRVQRRALNKEYEAYAQQAAASMLPGVAPPDGATPRSFKDVWHTAGDDGYKSAVFHAAVRCRAHLQSAGIEDSCDEDGNFAFKGHKEESGQELVSLHQACILFDEICKISSPLRDTLRFLQRELYRAIFSGYKSGTDVQLLTPFFVLRTHELKQVEQDRSRVKTLEREKENIKKTLERTEKKCEQLIEQQKKERSRMQKEDESFETVLQQRNDLKVKIEALRESNVIRNEELREVNQELTTSQASSYLVKKELDQARKDMIMMNSQLKDSNSKLVILMKRVADLQDALHVSGDNEAIQRAPIAAVIAAGAGGNIHNLELPVELEMELALLTTRGAKGRIPSRRKEKESIAEEASAQHSTIDGKRILHALLPDGGHQVILKGSVDDDTIGMHPPKDGGAGSAQATGSGRRKANDGSPPVLIVTGEAFAALSISQGLPVPVDPQLFGAADDENLLKEVCMDVQSLTEEHALLLELYRGLRQDLKRTLHLVPEHNSDELRGMLRNVLIFDPEESKIVPPPMADSMSIVGLGDGPEVPAYLRFTGTVALKLMSEEQVFVICQDFWRERTDVFLREEQRGDFHQNLDVFMNDVFLPLQAPVRPQQIELMYNFILELRNSTSLKPIDAGQELAKARSRRSKSAKAAGEELAKECPSCGTAFAPDAVVCKKCRTKRPGAENLKGGEAASRAAGGPTVPQFNAYAEVLYRGLLREIHEDNFHDASAMLLNFSLCCIALRSRFHSGPASALGDVEGDSYDINLAVFSAVLRLFFPSKPREHISVLKGILQPAAQINRMRVRNRIHQAVAETDESDAPKIKAGSFSEDAIPLSVNLQELFSLPTMEPDGSLQGGNLELLDNLLRRPSAFVQELRRQHLCECMLFVDKLQRALRANHRRSHMAGGGEKTAEQGGEKTQTGENMVTAKDVLDALATADKDLTQDQRYLYLLRGFGKRLPDMPSTNMAEESSNRDSSTEALAAAVRMQKVKRMLQDYAAEFIDSSSTIGIDDLQKRMLAMGVAKGGRHWQPLITCQQVADESGVSALAMYNAKPILEELKQAHIAVVGESLPPPAEPAVSDGAVVRSRAGTANGAEEVHKRNALEVPQQHPFRSPSKGGLEVPQQHHNRSASKSSVLSAGTVSSAVGSAVSPKGDASLLPQAPPEGCEPFEKYTFLAEVARGIQELSPGYPGLYLNYWVTHNL
eukprot:TRINITY_DN21960_c0_g1_i1.p1 TRINITY_DN21960_c0_g1~~TRINITY_DN21960_c0_g1_i1.p1  ORF type:complete len:1454 (-),score=354.93 TRINITY_DN21960_c0_g1_i1:117-4478(-)